MEGNPGYCDGNKMLLDEACLVIQNSARRSVNAYNVSSECFDCSPQRLLTVNPYSTKSVILSTTYDAILQFKVGNFISSNQYHFGQHGHYKFHVQNDNITWSTTDAPVSTYGPLWYALFTLTFAVALWGFICWLFTLERVTRYLPSCTLLARNVVIRDVGDEDLGGPSQRHRSSGDASPLIQTPPTETVKESNRTMSLDVFRGLTVTLMIFVNYGGGKYSIFEHSAWNGLTFADIVFPWFVWIMGISLALSIQSQLRNTVSRKRVFVKVLLRSLILIALGIILNSFKDNNVNRLRIPGVLQRLGLAYFIVGSVEAFLMTPQNHITVLVGRAQMVSDFIYGWKQWIIMMSLVILHTCLVMFVKLDGCPKGYHGPGGLHMNGKAFNCTGGLTGYIDRMIFGANHIYQHPTSSQVYNSTIPFDPEGLLGTLTTAFNMFLGVNAGRVLIVFPSSIQRNARWISSSFFCGIVALVLTASSKDHGIIPINKNLWSLSFVLASSSLASAAFIVLYTLIDDGKMWNGAPFRQVGRNALFLYVGHIITKNALPWNWAPVDMTTHGPLLWMNLWSTALWVIIAVIMDWCQIYVTI